MTKAARSTPRMSPLDSRQPTKSPWAPKKDMRDLLRRSPAATALLLAALAALVLALPQVLAAADGSLEATAGQNATLENRALEESGGSNPQAEVPGGQAATGNTSAAQAEIAQTGTAQAESAHASTAEGHEAPAPTAQEHAPTGHGAETGEHAEEHGEAHGESIWSTIARLVNFAILAGTLIYFLRSPFAQHLVNRAQQIRNDLAFAREARAAAEARMAEIERRLQALPADLDAIRQRGHADIATDRERISQAAEAERAALVEQARREIDLKVRLAEQTLVRRTADLAVGLARARLEAGLTRDDQVRLLDRYLDQLAAADRA